MSVSERVRVLAVVTLSPLSKSRVLAEMGIPRRTYYNWARQEKEKGLRDGECRNRRPWNKVKMDEEKLVIDRARSSPKALAPGSSLSGWLISTVSGFQSPRCIGY